MNLYKRSKIGEVLWWSPMKLYKHEKDGVFSSCRKFEEKFQAPSPCLLTELTWWRESRYPAGRNRPRGQGLMRGSQLVSKDVSCPDILDRAVLSLTLRSRAKIMRFPETRGRGIRWFLSTIQKPFDIIISANLGHLQIYFEIFWIED